MTEIAKLFLQGLILASGSVIIIIIVLFIEEVVDEISQTSLWLKFVTLKGRGREEIKTVRFKNLPNGRFYKIDEIINGRVAIVYFIKLSLGFKKMFKVYVKFPENSLENLAENTVYEKEGGKFTT